MSYFALLVPAIGAAVALGWLAFLAYAVARLLVGIARSMRGRR